MGLKRYEEDIAFDRLKAEAGIGIAHLVLEYGEEAVMAACLDFAAPRAREFVTKTFREKWQGAAEELEDE